SPVRRTALPARGGAAVPAGPTALAAPRAEAGGPSLAHSDRPAHAPAAAALADRDRLDRHDRRRGRDRVRDQAVGRQPVPDPLIVDGADTALRRGPGLRGPSLGPSACEPV